MTDEEFLSSDQNHYIIEYKDSEMINWGVWSYKYYKTDPLQCIEYVKALQENTGTRDRKFRLSRAIPHKMILEVFYDR